MLIIIVYNNDICQCGLVIYEERKVIGVAIVRSKSSPVVQSTDYKQPTFFSEMLSYHSPYIIYFVQWIITVRERCFCELITNNASGVWNASLRAKVPHSVVVALLSRLLITVKAC